MTSQEKCSIARSRARRPIDPRRSGSRRMIVQGRGDRPRVPGLHHEPRLPLLDPLRDAALARPDGRLAAGHRLAQGIGEGVVVPDRREEDHVRDRVVLGHLFGRNEPRENDPIPHSQFSGLPLQLPPELPVPDDHVLHAPVVQPGDGPDPILEPLPPDEPAHAHHDDIPVRKPESAGHIARTREGHETLRVDPVVEDLRLEAAIGADLAGVVAAAGQEGVETGRENPVPRVELRASAPVDDLRPRLPPDIEGDRELVRLPDVDHIVPVPQQRAEGVPPEGDPLRELPEPGSQVGEPLPVDEGEGEDPDLRRNVAADRPLPPVKMDLVPHPGQTAGGFPVGRLYPAVTDRDEHLIEGDLHAGPAFVPAAGSRETPVPTGCPAHAAS